MDFTIADLLALEAFEKPLQPSAALEVIFVWPAIATKKPVKSRFSRNRLLGMMALITWQMKKF